jgi:anti-anti-sigma regulatory factor
MTTQRIGRLDIETVGTRIVLAGRLDDSASLAALAAQQPVGPVTIDTAGVTFVNSIGIREWMRLVRGLRDRGCTLTHERVSDVLLAQLNLFGDLAQLAQITSFHAPYECAACGAESTQLLVVAEHAQLLRQVQAPKRTCPECGAAMDLGDFPERYLSVFKG